MLIKRAKGQLATPGLFQVAPFNLSQPPDSLSGALYGRYPFSIDVKVKPTQNVVYDLRINNLVLLLFARLNTLAQNFFASYIPYIHHAKQSARGIGATLSKYAGRRYKLPVSRTPRSVLSLTFRVWPCCFTIFSCDADSACSHIHTRYPRTRLRGCLSPSDPDGSAFVGWVVYVWGRSCKPRPVHAFTYSFLASFLLPHHTGSVPDRELLSFLLDRELSEQDKAMVI